MRLDGDVQGRSGPLGDGVKGYTKGWTEKRNESGRVGRETMDHEGTGKRGGEPLRTGKRKGKIEVGPGS